MLYIEIDRMMQIVEGGCFYVEKSYMVYYIVDNWFRR